MIYLFTFLFLFQATTLNAESEVIRIPVRIDGQIGFINDRGELAIPARFHAADIFANGLTPVRETGLYGYIDLNGDYVLPPAYEFAEPFRNGLARVWSEGKQQTIDQQGCAIFVNEHAEVFPFNGHSYASVESKGGKYGLINRMGKLLVDTILSGHLLFDELGLAAATVFERDREDRTYRYAVIDTSGQIKRPYQRLRSLEPKGNGYFQLVYPGDWQKDTDEPSAIVGPDGRITTKYNGYAWRPVEGRCASRKGVFPIVIHEVDWSTLRSWSSNDRLSHGGLVSADGEEIVDNPEWEHVSSFTDGRAFVYDYNHRYWLIDETGQKLIDTSFLAVDGFDSYGFDRGIFEDGVAILKRGRYWYRLDWDLNLTRLPEFGPGVKIERSGDLLFLKRETNNNDGDPYGYIHGWYDLIREKLIAPQYAAKISKVDETDLLTTEIDGQRVFLDRDGDLIWQSAKEPYAGRRNIDFYERATFAACEPLEDTEGRDLSLYNFYRTVPWGTHQLSSHELTLKAGIVGGELSINVANLTPDTLWFPAQDGVIGMILQARDVAGRWQDIQYLGQSWCGHSYHTLGLPSGSAWTFGTPAYDGAFSTSIRAKLTYEPVLESEEELVAFSNQVSARINPGQFWRKRTYYQGGLMDPYND